VSDPTTMASYVAGYKFTQSASHYDSGAGRFLDLAGYSPEQDIIVTTGTPVFETVGGKEGVVLNNTWHAKVHNPIPWMGTLVAVIKPNYVSGGTVEINPLIFGDAVTVSSNGRLRVNHASTVRGVRLATASGTLTATESASANDVMAVALATDQETRKGYSTQDGVTITETGPVSGTTNGNGVALGCALDGIRIGNTNGTAGNTTEVTTITATLFELYFFAENVFVADAAALATFIGELRTEYGL